MRTESGPLRFTLTWDEEDGAMISDIVGETVPKKEGTLSDVDWLQEDYSTCGTDLFYTKEGDFDALKLAYGTYTVTGKMWCEYWSSYYDGPESDVGFDIETIHICSLRPLHREEE